MPLAIPETPPCVLCLSAGDATAGGGLAADILTLASMGCHPLPVQTAALVRGMVSAVKIPVTAKMRLGWDDIRLRSST